MGIGFNLFFIFVLVPLSVIFLATWLLTRKKIFGMALGIIWIGIIGLALLSVISKWLSAKILLEKSDYYGEYIVNRDYFRGTHADWQYENYRFEIKENDSIYFHVTNKEKIIKTYRGTITTTKPFNSERIILNMDQPTHHIVTSNPTTYRSTRSFYLVFHSPKFNNVYFKKGQWKPLDK